LFVQADYLADDAGQETVDRFFEAYLLWLFGFVLFCSSLGDAVARYLIPHARRIADAPLDVVPQISWGNSILASAYRVLYLGVLKGRVADPILLGCPLLLQLWCHERFAIGRPVVALYAYEPLPEGHDPRDRFTMGSLWCLRKVISYFSLSICLSISSSLFNRDLWFTFGCMQTSYAHKHTKRAYKDFVGQFGALTDADVRWTPYSEEAIATHAPQCLSTLYFRDQ
jgi:hypothetical protein